MSLAASPFNKVRMSAFPKWFLFNHVEPRRYPFPRDAAGGWDTTRIDLGYIRHLERRVAQLAVGNCWAGAAGLAWEVMV